MGLDCNQSFNYEVEKINIQQCVKIATVIKSFNYPFV